MTKDEKRMVFQLEGCHWYDAVQEIAVLCRHTRDHDIKAIVENLLLPLGAFPPCLFVSAWEVAVRMTLFVICRLPPQGRLP